MATDTNDYEEMQLKIKQDEYEKWKVKLKNVVHSNTFCGMCLEDNQSVWDIQACITIAELGPGHECSLHQIMIALFGEDIQTYLASDIICEQCTDKAIQAYVFIHNTRKSSRILSTCLKNVNEDVEYTLTNILSSEEFQGYDKSIICLNLQEILDLDLEEGDREIDRHKFVNKDFICTLCNRNFATQEGLYNHELRHKSKEKKDETSQPALKVYDKLTITQCSQCKLVILNVELNEHMKKHKQRTWCCTLCDKIFYSLSSFDNHVMVRHKQISKDSLSTCELCVKTFFSDEMLQSHKCKYRCTECAEMPCPHQKYLVSYRDQKEAGQSLVQCIDCDFQCKKKIGLLSHINVEHLGSFNNVCNTCGMSFQSKPALTQHRRKYHNELFNCEYCGKTFVGNTSLEKHLIHCKAADKPFQCDLCDSAFVHKEALEEHKTRHFESERSCPICSTKFWTADQLEQHKKESHKLTISCSMCIEDFDSNDSYLEHVATHPPGTKHICRICDAKFNSKINHRKHIKWHSMSLEKKVCPICSKHINASYLKAHIDTHTAVKGGAMKRRVAILRKFKCDLCSKHFVSENVLRRHKEIHKDHAQCHICKKYVKPMMLESHIEDHRLEKEGSLDAKRKHWTKKIFRCTKCDYVTNYPLCMDAHDNRVHLKTRPYKCDVCSKDFYAKNYLYEHMKSHSGDIMRKKQCELCGNHFANSQCLKKHMRIHTGERPYPCDECDERFMSASRRQEHKLRRHSVPQIPCPVCKHLYHTVRDVRAHIKKSHCHVQSGQVDYKALDSIPEEHQYIFKDHRIK